MLSAYILGTRTVKSVRTYGAERGSSHVDLRRDGAGSRRRESHYLGAFKLSDWSTRAVLVFSGIYGSKVKVSVYRMSMLAGICAARSGLW
jgi:hypothetical protein